MPFAPCRAMKVGTSTRRPSWPEPVPSETSASFPAVSTNHQIRCRLLGGRGPTSDDRNCDEADSCRLTHGPARSSGRLRRDRFGTPTNLTASRRNRHLIGKGQTPWLRYCGGGLRRARGLFQGCQSSSSTRRRASSIASSSSRWSRPTNSPSRSGATADVCSMRTWVSSPSMVIVGRKILGAEEREVGATSTVDSIRSSDWRRTA